MESVAVAEAAARGQDLEEFLDSVALLEENDEHGSTDGVALDRFPSPLKGLPHPRSVGTYPRVLARYVREVGLLPLEEAIRPLAGELVSPSELQRAPAIIRGLLADSQRFQARIDRLRQENVNVAASPECASVIEQLAKQLQDSWRAALPTSVRPPAGKG